MLDEHIPSDRGRGSAAKAVGICFLDDVDRQPFGLHPAHLYGSLIEGFWRPSAILKKMHALSEVEREAVELSFEATGRFGLPLASSLATTDDRSTQKVAVELTQDRKAARGTKLPTISAQEHYVVHWTKPSSGYSPDEH